MIKQKTQYSKDSNIRRTVITNPEDTQSNKDQNLETKKILTTKKQLLIGSLKKPEGIIKTQEKVSTEKTVKLYNTLVRSVLLYNSSTRQQ